MSFLDSLSDDEIRTVKNALRAATQRDFFPDWEFETLIGVDRATVEKVEHSFPHRTVDPEEFICAVYGSMRNLLGYPHDKDADLANYVSGGAAAIRSVLDRLNELAG